MMNARSNSRGFTLIEILVVVAIIALLISILLPSLSKAREQTRMQVCKSNMRQVMTGMLLYVHEYKVLPGTQSVFYLGGYWPMVNAPDKKGPNWVWDGCTEGYGGDPKNANFIRDVPRRGTIFKYTKSESVYVCPSDRVGMPDDKDDLGGGSSGRNSYSMNAYIGYKSPEKLARPANSSGWKVEGNDRNGKPVRTPQKERLDWSNGDKMFVVVEEHPYYHKGFNFEGNFNVTDKIVARHSVVRRKNGADLGLGRSNVAFLDGHAESPLYSLETEAYDMFAQIGFPSTDTAFMNQFMAKFTKPPW
ncbi:MAG TPA: prepilin-type N-terminal cleavage/methylation domain-containing protein [Phycisphaerae bacterium]|nr:prepilin-type N-terminal cleavage/methylation domain-containing protein [Phycisphaerae bacterium]